MPMTPLPPNEKSDFISLITGAPYPGGPAEAARLQDILNYCEDVPTAIVRQLPLFAANNAYLTECLGVFTGNTLFFAKIEFNTVTATVTDPLIIANSTIDNVILTPNNISPPTQKGLVILGPSVITNIVITGTTVVNDIYIGPGAVVDNLDSSATMTSPPDSPPTSPPIYAIVNNIWLPNLRSQPSKLNRVIYGSIVNQVLKDEGSYYGGVQGYDPELPCSNPVTNMQVSEITGHGILISWTAPMSGFLFINTLYRLSGTEPWLKAATDDGYFTGNIGFVFTKLQKGTFYDFQAEVECNNGGRVTTEISANTSCCTPFSSPPTS